MVGRSRGLSMWSGVARLTNYSQFAWWMIRSSASYWGRRLTGRCVVCGGARNVHRVGPWTAPLAYACGWCNKRVQHGMNYGMGPTKLRQMLES